MLTITFLPKKHARVKPVSYLVNQYNNVVAVAIAKKVMMQEHNINYYSGTVVISEARVLG